jgi:hypothetical protein
MKLRSDSKRYHPHRAQKLRARPRLQFFKKKTGVERKWSLLAAACSMSAWLLIS